MGSGIGAEYKEEYMQNEVVKILMRRDGLTKNEAENQILLTQKNMESAIASGNYDEAESILMDELMLELDYCFDVLEFKK